MSYHTHVDIQTSDDIDATAALEHARLYLDAMGIYSVEHVLENLKTALAQGSCGFKGMRCDDFEGLMEAVSSRFPSVAFFVRGMGEEFADVWLRQFEDGKASAPPIGPFEMGE